MRSPPLSQIYHTPATKSICVMAQSKVHFIVLTNNRLIVKIMRDKLIRAFVLLDDLRLPFEKIHSERTAVFLKGAGIRSVRAGAWIGKLVKGRDGQAPMVEAVGVVHRFNRAESSAQPFAKAGQDPLIANAVVLRLIVDLKADHIGTGRRFGNQLADDTFAIFPGQAPRAIRGSHRSACRR